MGFINILMIFFSALLCFSIFITLDSILRVVEWEVLDNKERVGFWGGIRDTGFKISMISLILSIALNSVN